MKKTEVVKTETEIMICQSTDISLGLKLNDGVLTYTGKFEYDSAMEVLINENKPFIEKVDFSQAIELFVLPDRMFSKCKNLREVLLPEGLNIIGKYAFGGCESLREIDMPSVESIEKYAFYKSCIETVSLPNLKVIGEKAFYGCKLLRQIDLPSVESIGEGAFERSGIESISLPNLKVISEWAFKGCESLRQIDLPSVESIEEISEIAKQLEKCGIDSKIIHMGTKESFENIAKEWIKTLTSK